MLVLLPRERSTQRKIERTRNTDCLQHTAMTDESFTVRIVSKEEWEAGRRERYLHRELVAAGPWLKWQDANPQGFMWECPGCGGAYWGDLGEQPVGGWAHPQWVNSGTREAPTLTPSLGCGAWHRGECSDGHWWMRAGKLVRA